MTLDVAALKRLERIARTLRYRATGACITAPELDGFTDAQLAAALLTETTTVVTSTMETDR